MTAQASWAGLAVERKNDLAGTPPLRQRMRFMCLSQWHAPADEFAVADIIIGLSGLGTCEYARDLDRTVLGCDALSEY